MSPSETVSPPETLEPPKLTTLVTGVETWQILADRSVEGGTVPDWVADVGGFGPFSLGPYEDQPDSIAVGVRFGVKDGEIAVSVELAIIFRVRLNGEPPDEGLNLLDHIGQENMLQLISRSITEAGPFLREAIYSTSGRLRPGNPIFVPGSRMKITGASFERVDEDTPSK